MKVSVVGTGYVGLVTGACLAEASHQVTCVDIDRGKIDRINRGETPIYEEGLEPLLRRHVGSSLRATNDLEQAVRDSEITFIAVGTPFDGRHIDLSYVKRVASEIGSALRNKNEYHAVVVKSTVVPGTTDGVVRPILEDASKKRAGIDFGVGMNPEFLTEGVAVRDFMQPDRIVLGGMDDRTIEMLAQVYEPFKGVPVVRTNNKTAEMIKYTSNAVLATMISFSNEIGNLCSSLGDIDVVEVMQGVHLAHYFTVRTPGDTGYAAAPITSFLQAGCGFGGSCLPKDVSALIAHGEAAGLPMPLLDAVIRINRKQPKRVIELLEQHFPSLRGVKVSVLGLAFKPDTDDMRESPAIPIVRELLERGAEVSAYDPVATESAAAVFGNERIRFLGSLDSALREVDAVVLVTRWDEFQRVPDVLATMETPPLVIDGRRMVDKQRIRRYAGIGFRPSK